MYPKPALIPFPKDVKFGACLKRRSTSAHTCECPSTRVRRVFSRLNLDQYSFGCEFDKEEFGQVPSLDSNYEYTLRIDKNTIFVHAVEEWGALAALSTLAQLWAGFRGQLPDCEIHDAPMYRWRGVLIDVARHFISLPTLLSCCDLMHHFKLNVLHLHLSDDQGFRFGSKEFPELVSREHYSMEELNRLIAYAADVGVRVVPELDVPGHTTSWLERHPEWGFGEVSEDELARFGPHRGCLDPSNPATINAVLTLFKEMANIFPDEYIHIGGDEVDPSFWESSASVQAWAAARQLDTVSDIQAYFTQEVCNHFKELNKKPIVWDEALHATLPQSVTVQAWRGLRARDMSVGTGYPTIVSAPYYLDLNYSAATHFAYSPDMPTRDWRAVDARVIADPLLAHVAQGMQWHQDFGEFPEIPNRKSGTILGGEACMWSELVSDKLLLTRVWTRTPAIAERLWSSHDVHDVECMYDRLCAVLQALPLLGLPDLVSLESIHPCSALNPLFEMLEPVKWYGRLLTMERVRARAKGSDESTFSRPYNQQTPLNRVVDRLPPESLVSYQLARRVKHGEDLSSWIIGWQNQAIVFEGCVSEYPELEELRAVSQALAKLADVALGKANYDPTLAGPFGEYLLPIATAFADDS